MAEMVLKGPCIHCNKETELDLPDEIVSVMKRPKGEVKPVSELEAFTGKFEKLENEIKELKAKPEKPKEERKGPRLPAHAPRYKCKDCDSLHKNPDYQGLPKGQCDTCQSYNHSKKEGKCPYCKDGEIEPVSKEDLIDRGMYVRDDDQSGEDEHEHRKED